VTKINKKEIQTVYIKNSSASINMVSVGEQCKDILQQFTSTSVNNC
jgi:hypothetical protein